MSQPLTSDRVASAFEQLKALGAGDFAHLNGSLAEHLRHTEALLRQWGNRDAVCLAGLYHAVYGTDAFDEKLVSLDMRQAIATIIGSEAEALTYLYGACNRKTYYPRIGTSEQFLFADRFAQSEYAIDESQVRDLCELILANEMELLIAGVEFRSKFGVQLAKLFARMQGLVSTAGFEDYRRLLA